MSCQRFTLTCAIPRPYIILADRQNPNIDAIDNGIDLDLDMLLIRNDFFAWLQDQEGFIFTKSSQIVKLSDEYGVNYPVVFDWDEDD